MAGGWLRRQYKALRRYRWLATLTSFIFAAWKWGGAAVNFIGHHLPWLLPWLLAMLGGAATVFAGLRDPEYTYPLVAGLLTFLSILGIAREIRWARLYKRPAPIASPTLPVTVQTKDALGEILAEIEKEQTVRYADWDHIDPLKLWQAAELWAGNDPVKAPAGGSNQAYPVALWLKQEIMARRLEYAGLQVHLVPGARDDPEYVPNDVPLLRADLRASAERRKEKPLFLYPDQRKS